MTNYLQLFRLFLKRLGIIFILYQLCRLLFFLFNTNAFQDVALKTVWGGMVYDLSAIGFINLIFVLLYLIPGNFKYTKSYQKFLKTGFFTINMLFLATNFVDIEYYKFTGRRSSFSLITAKGMENEIAGLLQSYLVQFWYLPIGFFILAIIVWKWMDKKNFSHYKDSLTPKHIFRQTGIFILSTGVMFLMARGGLQNKPLKIVDAIKFSALGNTALVLNTPFCIIKTINNVDELSKEKYFDEVELKTIFNPEKTFESQNDSIKKNVMIIILESFGNENIQKGYTPFLDSLLQHSLYFKNGFANGRVSIDAVPSTLSSIPSLMSTSLISSRYSLNKVYGLPKIFKNQGYHTSFFHGAFNGSQNFDQYCRIAGFDHYYGKDQYPYDDDSFDGKWGIFDEEFLQFFCEEIGTFTEPFFTSVFTISSHQPFIMPEKYKGKFPKGKTKIHETIGYTDYALRKFFDKAKKQSWYNNTLFVITADHASPYLPDNVNNSVGEFRIPILFMDPSRPEINGINEKNLQQIDILPSILSYLNIRDKVITFGKSYQSEEDFVVTYLDNIYNYFKGDYYLAFDGQKSIGLFAWKKDTQLKNNLLKKEPELVKSMEKFIKAYIQTFNERVSNDALIVN